ncbi:hypothetical protein [Nocardia sp. NPDC049526]|uniref:hypothetical protein n=1 Tax=Nocardia sp. NPDC049526 TaxID=3364316 RepID=UPI0037A4947E
MVSQAGWFRAPCYIAFHRENPLALRILALTDVDVSESELATKAKVQIDAVLSGSIESFTAAVRLVSSDAEPQALVMVWWAAVNGAYARFPRWAESRADIRHLTDCPMRPGA